MRSDELGADRLAGSVGAARYIDDRRHLARPALHLSINMTRGEARPLIASSLSARTLAEVMTPASLFDNDWGAVVHAAFDAHGA